MKKAAHRKELFSDGCVLLLVFAVSAAPYVGRLGFYSDDWAFLHALAQDRSQSSSNAFPTRLLSEMNARPGQALLLSVIHHLFGANPLPWHLVNHVILAAAVLLLYITLRLILSSRSVAFATAALFALLPHYSTDRFWIAAIQAPASIFLYLACLYSGLRSITSVSRTIGTYWLSAAVGLEIASLLCYELTLPLFALNCVLWWRHARAQRLPLPRLLMGATVCVTAAIAAAKAAMMSERLGASGNALTRQWWLIRTALNPFYSPQQHFGFNLYWAFITAYIQNGLFLPYAAWQTIRPLSQWNLAGVVASVFIGLTLYFWLGRIEADPLEDLRGEVRGGLLAVAGVALFFLGYGIFLFNANLQFTPAGIANRTAIAAAIGVSLSITGVARLVAVRAAGPRAFALIVAAAGTLGSLVISSSAVYWSASYITQKRVLDEFVKTFPAAPPAPTLLLDGVCTYIGPAPVFESSWDFADSLSLRYRELPRIAGNVISPRAQVGPTGIAVEQYGGVTDYPYAPGTAIWNAAEKRLYPLPDERAARAYFAAHDRTNGCPPALPGHGVTIY